MASIVWNLIPRNTQVEEAMRQEMRQKIAQLEDHLQTFPTDKLHLQVLVQKQPRKDLYTVRLTLRLPGHILRSEESAPELRPAFDQALQALVKELEAQQERRLERELRSPGGTAQPPPSPERASFTPEPQPQGTGPQTFQEVVRDFLQQHYQRLIRHAQRHLRQAELSGEIPPGALDPRDIVDEVARQAEAQANRKPKRVTWLVWLVHLLHEQLHREIARLQQEQAAAVPTEKPTVVPELKLNALQPMEQMVEKVMEPEILRTEDVVPNPEAVPPDRAVEARELLEQLQGPLRRWPRPEREVFELYFVEGFEPDEIAQITRRPLKQVKETLATVQRRLREELLREEALT